MKDKKKLIVLIVMLLMPVAGIWYFIKMSLKYMKGAEIGIFFPNNFFKQFGVWSIIWIILWIVIMFIERKYKVKKIKERKIFTLRRKPMIYKGGWRQSGESWIGN